MLHDPHLCTFIIFSYGPRQLALEREGDHVSKVGTTVGAFSHWELIGGYMRGCTGGEYASATGLWQLLPSGDFSNILIGS